MKKYLFLIPMFLFSGFLISLTLTRFADDFSHQTASGGSYQSNAGEAIYNGKKLPVPKAAGVETPLGVLGTSNEERWIEIDLSEQKLKAWEGSTLFLETLVSTGLPWTPTPTGEFRIWTKFKYTKMEGGVGRYYYYLPNVPYVMFFENSMVPGWKGYGLHGTYWHNDFGTTRSHGCVNLPTNIAKLLYYWTSPGLPEGKNSVRASEMDKGTRIVIHS